MSLARAKSTPPECRALRYEIAIHDALAFLSNPLLSTSSAMKLARTRLREVVDVEENLSARIDAARGTRVPR